MRVSATDIVTAFQDLLTESRSREAIASWASSVRHSDDAEAITCDPSEREHAIWSALEFLMGVDLRDGPESYLHNRRDFDEYWQRAKVDLIG